MGTKTRKTRVAVRLMCVDLHLHTVFNINQRLHCQVILYKSETGNLRIMSTNPF